MRIETYYKLNESWRVSNNPSTLYRNSIEEIFEIINNPEKQIIEEGFKDTVKKVGNELNIAKRFVTTFGTGVGAFYPAVSRFLENSSILLNREEVMLLIVTSISMILHSEEAEQLKLQVKEKGLSQTLISVYKFISSFSKFMSLVRKKTQDVASSLSDMLGYTAMLVPVVGIITKLINKQHIDINNYEDLFKGLAASASAYGIKTLIDKTKDTK